MAVRKSLSVGDLVLDGKYTIEKIIHTKGMSNVYLVRDNSLKAKWCLKEIVKSEAGRDMVEYYSLLQEANIMKGLNNPNIPRIVTIEDDGDSTFIIMDYVEGVSVKELLVKRGVIGQQVAVNWMKQVCGVMMYLHNRNNPIIYRDMKPDNIMVQDDGNIRVLDFGISEVITPDNQVIKRNLGTRGYAAPEQKKAGNKYDLRSDIYSLGMTFYHMLTGIHPGVIKGSLKPLREVDSSLSVGLEVIINKCTMESPDDRYQSVEELLYDLKNFDKLDISYKKKLKRRVGITVGMFVISLGLIFGSFIPLGLYNSRQGELYLEKIEIAEKTGRSSDYLNAIEMQPLKLEPYSGLIESFKQDGVFTKEEEGELLNIINPILTDIKSEKGYGELSYDIGKLYWFYYDGDDGDTVSSKWFLEAINNEYSVDEAKLYYDLGNFKKSISMAIVESEDAGMYLEYWNNLQSAKGIVSGEIMELQVYNSIADVIDVYPYRLRVDGLSKEDVDKEIKNIGKFIKSSNPISEKSLELFDRLKSKYATLQDKVDIAYSDGGVE